MMTGEEATDVVTIADVARRAGVAPSTVSYVLTGRRSISSATRRSVERAIADLDYRPHAGARAMRGSRTHVLALSEPAWTGPFRTNAGEFVHDLSTAARGHGYDLLILTNAEGTAGIRRLAGSRIADGVVLMSVLTDEPRLAVLRELGFPAALLGRPADPQGVPWCDFDFSEAAALAVRELARLGHRSTVLVSASERDFRLGLNYAPRVVSGARTEARRVGMNLAVIHRPSANATLARRIRQALDVEPRPTAIVTHDELPSVIGILREHGLDVPRDISVIAVSTTTNDSEIPLTRMPLPIRDMSELAVAKAVAAIDGCEQEGPSLIPPRLIQGRSVAPPADGVGR